MILSHTIGYVRESAVNTFQYLICLKIKMSNDTLSTENCKVILGFKGNFEYCPRATFLRRETEKVVWVPSFDHFQICINTGFRYVYVWWMFPHFQDKKVTKMCPKYLLTRYYK